MAKGTWIAAVVAAALAAQVGRHWSPVGAEAWYPPQPLPRLERNEILKTHGKKILENRVLGPESMAIDHRNGIVYTGTMNGEIVRFDPNDPERSFESVLFLNESCSHLPQVFRYEEYDPNLEPICGRPLGMKFDPKREGVLFVLDSYKGILEIDVNSKTSKVLYDGAKLANDLDTDGEDIFFSESSPRWGRNKIILEIMAGRRTGKLMRFRLSGESQGPEAVVENVPLTNGVTLSHDKTMVYFVSGPAVHAFSRATNAYVGIVVNNLPCVGDNIRRHPKDGKTYLLGCGIRRAAPFSLADMLAPYPMIRELLLALIGYNQNVLFRLIPKHSMVLQLDLQNGNVLKSIQDPSGSSGCTSEAELVGSSLLLGSWRDSWLITIPWEATGF